MTPTNAVTSPTSVDRAPGPLAWEPITFRRGPSPLWLLLPALVAVLAIVAIFIRLPYDALEPGGTRSVNELVAIDGKAKTYPLDGVVMYPTVSLKERINPYEALIGWLDSTVQIESEKDIRGPIPRQQFEQLNQVLMSESKQSAEVVVFRRLGTQVAQGAIIAGVEPGYPGAAALRQNDVVTSVDGKPIALADDLVQAVRARKPGDRLKLRVARGTEAPRDLEVTLAGRPERTMLGVQVSTKIQLPYPVNIDSGNVGGPSAGLAYALELFDLLTPGQLTNGRVVAATGELDLAGRVSAVGGVAQKTVSVRRAGADVFLVPRANFKEARAHQGKHLKVVAVDDFEDAVRALNPPKP